MLINKISTNTNFGIWLTDKAVDELKRNGTTDFQLGTLPCKLPTEALIGISKFDNCPYIEGKHGRIEAYNKKMTMQTINELCREYNVRKFFSVLRPEKKSLF